MAGQFEIVERALALADDATVIIPGHGVISDRQGLLKFRNQSASWLERVGALHRQGLGVEAIQSDDQVQRIKESFLAQANGKEIPEDRFQRFIQRTISTELIPRYPLMGSTASRYVGRYELEDGSSFEIIDQHGTLYARNDGVFLVELIPVSETRFHLRGWIRDHFRFHADATGRIDKLTHESDGSEDRIARRVTP